METLSKEELASLLDRTSPHSLNHNIVELLKVCGGKPNYTLELDLDTLKSSAEQLKVPLTGDTPEEMLANLALSIASADVILRCVAMKLGLPCDEVLNAVTAVYTKCWEGVPELQVPDYQQANALAIKAVNTVLFGVKSSS